MCQPYVIRIGSEIPNFGNFLGRKYESHVFSLEPKSTISHSGQELLSRYSLKNVILKHLSCLGVLGSWILRIFSDPNILSESYYGMSVCGIIEGFGAKGNLFLHVDFFVHKLLLFKRVTRKIGSNHLVANHCDYLFVFFLKLTGASWKIQFYLTFIHLYSIEWVFFSPLSTLLFLLWVVCLITWFSRSSSALCLVAIFHCNSFQWFSRTSYTVIIYYRLPEKKHMMEIHIFMAEELRYAFILMLCYFSYGFIFSRRFKRDWNEHCKQKHTIHT